MVQGKEFSSAHFPPAQLLQIHLDFLPSELKKQTQASKVGMWTDGEQRERIESSPWCNHNYSISFLLISLRISLFLLSDSQNVTILTCFWLAFPNVIPVLGYNPMYAFLGVNLIECNGTYF